MNALEKERATIDILRDPATQESFRKAGYNLKIEQTAQGEVGRIELRDASGQLRFYSNIKELNEGAQKPKEEDLSIN